MRSTEGNSRVPSRREVWGRMLLYPRHTLPTALAPVLVGTGLAVHAEVFAAGAAAAAFLAGWLVQLGGVFADNYHNLRRHSDDREHPLMVRALEEGVISLRLLYRATASCYGLALVPGAYLTWIGGVPVLTIGCASALASLAYSTEPLRLGDRGLGDPLFFLFFGPVSVAGAHYVQFAATGTSPLPLGVPAGGLTAASLVAGVPMGALITSILLIDNIRDLRFDREKGERTLAVIIGRRSTQVELVALEVVAYLVPFWFLGRPAHGAEVLLPLLTIPYAWLVTRRVVRADGFDDLVPLTPQAGQLALAYAALFALGLAL